MSGLNVKAWLALVVLAVVMGALLFAAAGTLRYWQGWVFLAVFFAASLLITLYLMKYDPALLQRRMAGGPTAEKGRTQKVVMLLASIGFVALLVVPALGYRLGMVASAALSRDRRRNVLIAAGFYRLSGVRENSLPRPRYRDHRRISRSSAPGRMPSSATRNMSAASFIFSACRSRSAPIGGSWSGADDPAIRVAAVATRRRCSPGAARLRRLPAICAVAANPRRIFNGLAENPAPTPGTADRPPLPPRGQRLQRPARFGIALRRPLWRQDRRLTLSDAGVAKG